MNEGENITFNSEINAIIDSKTPVSFVNMKYKMNKDKKDVKINIFISVIFIICLIQLIIIILLKKNRSKNKGRLKLNITNLQKEYLYKEDKNKTKYTNKKEIHISMSLDNNAIYPTLISMTSALENNNKEKNILVYYLLLSHDFNVSNIEIFESLKNHYQFKINYYIIPNIFENFDKWRDSDTIYYKLLLPFIFPDHDRIIFLDGDTLVFKDISEMYELPFNGNYVLGFPFHTPWIIDKLGINSKYYINGRVILLNIKKIRKNNMDINLLKYTVENYNNVLFLEQDTLNYIFYDKIGFLPLKYGTYLFGNISDFKKYYMEKFRVQLNLTELDEAIKDPSIVHLSCCNPKVWNKTSVQEHGSDYICQRYQKKFYYYANKTDYYFDIYNKYMK